MLFFFVKYFFFFFTENRDVAIRLYPTESLIDEVDPNFGNNIETANEVDEEMMTFSTSPPGIQNFLGVGYDIIDGNPEGGEIMIANKQISIFPVSVCVLVYVCVCVRMCLRD